MAFRPTHTSLAAAILATLAACISPRAHVPRVTLPRCLSSVESIEMDAALHAVADRRAGNRLRLPWSDSTPPAPVQDAAICAQAAEAYARGASPSDPRRLSAGQAGVVRAGGLYFVLAPPAQQAGEWMIVAVLDAKFRWIVGLTA